jgi:hypothetical protein
MSWSGKWIGYRYDPREDLGFFAFRNLLTLQAVPESLTVRVSADNRYKLFVNGELVSFGPQRGDEKHWFYETLDLAPFLQPGENEIVALVWNFGFLRPMAQHSVRTGFLADCDEVSSLSTPGDWQVRRVAGWDFEMMHSSLGDFYIDVGPGEIIEARGASYLTEREGYSKPYTIYHAEERGQSTGGTPWMLIPRSIPPMRYEVRTTPPIVRPEFDGTARVEGGPLKLPIKLASGEKLLLDYQELLCAYPRLRLTSTQGAELRLTYAEALWNRVGRKGNRDVVGGKTCSGYQDRFVPDEQLRIYQPAWWRTYRYLLLEATGDGEVHINGIDAVETGYPLAEESTFTADDSWVEKIWNVSLRTAQRCAGETYFDCPYYEQLQYVGDTRIQALIGYYLGRDRLLQRNAVETLGWSLMSDGLTQSRYPSHQAQVIPPFSLWYVMMLYDQMLYDDVWPNTSVAEQIIKCDHTEYWQFADWVHHWPAGVPPRGSNAEVHRLTRALAYACRVWLQECAKFYGNWRDLYVGQPILSTESESQLRERRMRFDKVEGLVHTVGDSVQPGSEHAEALWRLLQIVAEIEPDEWPSSDLQLSNAAKCTYYFAYYKHLAMFGRQGVPFDYMEELQPWKEQIEDGLTTFAENPEPTRSDCHAWSAHPILGFFQIVAGVTSVAPGWQKAKIMPHPGNLTRFDAGIAHPRGELRVRFEESRLSIESPIPFQLLWKGKTADFESGSYRL